MTKEPPTYEEKADEYYWGVFLKGYCLDNPEYKDEFNKAARLNRHDRRKLQAKANKLNKKRKAHG